MKNLKKAIFAAVCVAAAATSAFTFAACGGTQTPAEAVQLFAVEATDVGAAGVDADYFVAAEPAATTRANATGLKFAGDLQQLYGAEGGYPQAVIVAKNELIEENPAFITSFLAEVEANTEWLSTASPEVVIDAVSSHLPAGTTPTFTAKNLTAQVIANCGINFVDAKSDKSRVTAFLEEMIEVSPTSTALAEDAFFCEELGTASAQSEVDVYMPDGAPALALAKLMAEDMTDFGGTSVTYNVVAANAISSYVTGAEPAAEICVLPVNAAAKLLGNGQTFKMLGTVTNGNLYLLTKDGANITTQNIEQLAGKKIGVIQLANVPGLTLKIILNKYDIPFAEQQ